MESLFIGQRANNIVDLCYLLLSCAKVIIKEAAQVVAIALTAVAKAVVPTVEAVVAMVAVVPKATAGVVVAAVTSATRRSNRSMR